MSAWRRARFWPHFVALDVQETRLPFSVGGGTQQGRHGGEALNNQDAAGLGVAEDLLVGVICDGCAGAQPSAHNTYSDNEVAAKLTVHLALQAATELAGSVGLVDADAFVKQLSHRLLSGLSSVLDALAPSVACEEQFVLSFLMATVLGFVVGRDRYIVFGAGDGLVCLNGEVRDLDDRAGEYLASALALRRRDPAGNDATPGCALLSRIYDGSTRDLQSLFIATDGCRDLVSVHPVLFAHFTTGLPAGKTGGYDGGLLQEFRRCLIWHQDFTRGPLGESPPGDDCTFVLLRRVTQQPPAERAEHEQVVSGPGRLGIRRRTGRRCRSCRLGRARGLTGAGMRVSCRSGATNTRRRWAERARTDPRRCRRCWWYSRRARS